MRIALITLTVQITILQVVENSWSIHISFYIEYRQTISDLWEYDNFTDEIIHN